MGFVRTVAAAFSAVLLSGAIAVGAQEEQRPVMIYDYAISHPLEDADLAVMPTIGASVPQAVTISTIDDSPDSVYGYFYYQGQPIIVDLTTRSVVRVGN